MDKPQYELGPLREAVIQCKTNILYFERAIDKEKEKIAEYEHYINEWVTYNEWLKTQQ
jgi:hypothetical protein